MGWAGWHQPSLELPTLDCSSQWGGQGDISLHWSYPHWTAGRGWGPLSGVGRVTSAFTGATHTGLLGVAGVLSVGWAGWHQPSVELPTLDCWERLGSSQWGGQGDISLHCSYPHWTAGSGWGPLSRVGRVTSAFTAATHTGLLRQSEALSVGWAGWHQPSLQLPTLDCWDRLRSSQWGGQGDISLHWSCPPWTAGSGWGPLSGVGRVTSAFTGATHTELLGQAGVLSMGWAGWHQPSLELPTLDCWERLGSSQWGGLGDISLHWSCPHWTAWSGWDPLSGVGRVTSAFTGATHTGLLGMAGVLSVGWAGWHQPSLELPTLDCWERLGSSQWGGQGDISLHWSYPHRTAGRGWDPLSGVGRMTSAFTGATYSGLLGEAGVLSVGWARWHQPSLELPTLDCWERLGSSQ